MKRSAAKPMIWPEIVAIAAPLTPMSNPNMSIGSMIMFISAPEMMPTMAYFAFPLNLIWLLRVRDAAIKGVPIRIIPRYSFAYGRIVSVEPRAWQMGVRNIRPVAAMRVPARNEEKSPTVAIVSACPVFLAPSILEI